MRLLRIQAEGFPLFKGTLDIPFITQQRVTEDDKCALFHLSTNPDIYTNTAVAVIGINASGKTSVLKLIRLALGILSCENINEIESKTVLCGATAAVLRICFLDNRGFVCLLETKITSEMADGNTVYSITEESLREKPLSKVKTKGNLTTFENIRPVEVREGIASLYSGISFIILHNSRNHDSISYDSLLSFTNVNVLPSIENIPLEVVTFLDPTIEHLFFRKNGNGVSIHLKFFRSEEIILTNPRELELYLSSGTIKGILTFTKIRSALQSGGYLILDEIENHFNREIVASIIRFFLDSDFNRNGATLVFATHYPELLDEYDRNDGIFITRNTDRITMENLSSILGRNDIKKSDAYQSGLLKGTTPLYESYINLKRTLAESMKKAGTF